ncbi:hypothetical protein [Ornithinimicrobium sp. Y1694]|uniref:hypothetical protein n=1 Tax=Ornithinimicrobium sp. Y1694 TaxID=3418590 RepID=UPI003CF7ED55
MDEEYLVDDEDRKRYAAQMERVRLRIDEAAGVVDQIRDERAVVYAAVQLRLAIEEVAFASLVGNRKAMEEAERSVAVNGWDKVTKSLKVINPNYWPRGVREVRGETNEWLDVTGGVAESDVARIWGRLSQVLHARNPWREPLDLKEERAFIQELIGRLRTTLNSHFITLVGGRQKLFCQVGSQPVRVYLFSRVEDEGL